MLGTQADRDAADAAAKRIAESITSRGGGVHDEAGVYVESLTEAVMGMTAGLVRIAMAIELLAEVTKDKEL